VSTDRVGLCVVGLGWGLNHARAYSQIEDVDLYVCDTDASRIEQARREFKLTGAFSTVDEALSSPSVTAVDVTLPNSMHAPVAAEAARRGKHCMVEKPLATSLAEADRMREEAEKAGTVLAVGENFQFSALNLKAAEIIRSGQIGRVSFINVLHEMWPIYFARSSWWFDRKMAGGGVLLCAGVHAIRTLRMLAPSEMRAVFAVATSFALGIESEDTCLVTAEFEDGAIGSIPASWTTPHADNIFEVHGSKGSIICRRAGGIVIRSNVPDHKEEKEVETESVDTIKEECAAFVGSVRSGIVDERIGFERGRKDLEVVEAAYLSVARKERVRLPLEI
jgi:predicted dehydrogenase